MYPYSDAWNLLCCYSLHRRSPAGSACHGAARVLPRALVWNHARFSGQCCAAVDHAAARSAPFSVSLRREIALGPGFWTCLAGGSAADRGGNAARFGSAAAAQLFGAEPGVFMGAPQGPG